VSDIYNLGLPAFRCYILTKLSSEGQGHIGKTVTMSLNVLKFRLHSHWLSRVSTFATVVHVLSKLMCSFV